MNKEGLDRGLERGGYNTGTASCEEGGIGTEKAEPIASGKAADEGRYVYCVVESSKSMSFGRIGIEGNEVYAIPYGRISAIVHNCPLKPYKSDREEEVKNWVKAHQGVIDRASRLGPVIPFSFDIIIKGSNGGVLSWLKKEHEVLTQKINKVRDRQEFGVQIFWDRNIIGDIISMDNEGIKRLRKGIERKPRGRAYFLKHRLEGKVKGEIEKAGNGYFREFYGRIKKHTDDIKVERTSGVKGKQMLMNLSCLVHKNRAKELGAVLGNINNLEGFSVRFTGPWPPYSFV